MKGFTFAFLSFLFIISHRYLTTCVGGQGSGGTSGRRHRQRHQHAQEQAAAGQQGQGWEVRLLHPASSLVCAKAASDKSKSVHT